MACEAVDEAEFDDTVQRAIAAPLFNLDDLPIIGRPLYGLRSMSQFAQVAYLQHETAAGQTSSYSRKSPDCWLDCRSDSFDRTNYLYSENGEQVLLDVKNPGTIYRMWFTKSDWSTNPIVRVYFDGETQPRIEKELDYIFSGTHAPFLAPLVVNTKGSSGGYVSYLPLPFSSAVKVTLANNTNTPAVDTDGIFYNIGYHQFEKNTEIETWTGTEDSSAVRDMWYRVGSNPTPNINDATTYSGTKNLKNSPLILALSGPKSINSIRFKIPGVYPDNTAGTITDKGRSFKSYSTFKMMIDHDNQGVFLKRRFDYSVADQKAKVYVDNQFVGYWHTPGKDSTNRWRDSSFYIPSKFTANKDTIGIKIVYVSSSIDWNEFTYWAYSILAGANTNTDILDVGNTTSEQQHSYIINYPVWSGSRTYSYPTTSIDANEILSAVHLKIKWDGEANDSVDAPLNMLFATGNNNVFPTRSLAVGLDELGFLYLYFPMPFKKSAEIRVEGNGANLVPESLDYEVSVSPIGDNFDSIAYFKTAYQEAITSVYGRDLPILQTRGQGIFVGNVISYYHGAGNGNYLEGDERIHVDESASPSMHGTGTEDFFNAGWYFRGGFFSNPLSGFTGTKSGSWTKDSYDSATVYRFLIQDAVPFKSEIKVSIEHGNYNEARVQADILAFYYEKPTVGSSLTLTDALEVHNAQSEYQHQYTIKGQSWKGIRAYSHEGDNPKTTTLSGRAFKGAGSYSQFYARINADNRGVILRRTFDQTIGRQSALVFVDNVLVGEWYTAGENAYHQWRTDDFHIPSAYTSQKSLIKIKVMFASSDLDWNEFVYKIYSQEA